MMENPDNQEKMGWRLNHFVREQTNDIALHKVGRSELYIIIVQNM